ncbi:hypothetical protein ZIOFF_056995 [Zingiber officinale]|uniref:Polygalacturonase n=1 Tax=Zingiber officinale TaxID=94328 RepID=A0A8J5FIV2_ZINOF|nr:hypothetical protein ZIOFF_056995 [Zingiber officinale]
MPAPCNLIDAAHRFPLLSRLLRTSRLTPLQLRQSHACMLKTGLHLLPLPVSKLLAAASSLAEPAYALSIFHCIASPCLFHHTAVLRSLSSAPGARSVADAFSLFRSLHASPGLVLNQFVFIPTVKVLAQGLRLQLGRQLHALALKLGFLLYVNVRNTLIHLYCRCGRVSDDGLHLFDEMPLRNDRVIPLGKDQLSPLTLMAILFLLPPIALPATFDVINYGAIGDGKTDDSQAFLRAWAAVCKDASATPSVLNIGFKTFLINAVLNFMGPCKPSSITQVLMNGCNNLVVKGLKLVNSQRSHLAITNCNDVLLSQLTITSPGDSPNTDGIDVSNSRRIRIEWSTIATGDDCIAINRGTYQINITGIACGPGHGISIGSLGKDKSSSEEVTDVIVKQCNFTRTTNGVRIKTWQGGVGFASRIIFEDINFISTRNPIIIDQTYCDKPYGYCKNVPGAVKVTGVTYQRMHGTSPDPVAVTLTCSPLAPCSGIVMKEVMIRRDDGGATSSFCSNALGSIGKECQPKVNCLTTTS